MALRHPVDLKLTGNMSEGSKRAKRNDYRKNLYFTDEDLFDLRSTDDDVDECLARLSMDQKRYLLVEIISLKAEYKATITNEELLVKLKQNRENIRNEMRKEDVYRKQVQKRAKVLRQNNPTTNATLSPLSATSSSTGLSDFSSSTASSDQPAKRLFYNKKDCRVVFNLADVCLENVFGEKEIVLNAFSFAPDVPTSDEDMAAFVYSYINFISNKLSQDHDILTALQEPYSSREHEEVLERLRAWKNTSRAKRGRFTLVAPFSQLMPNFSTEEKTIGVIWPKKEIHFVDFTLEVTC
jgi:hypothetical protein